jgi:hypothetical protein
MLYKSFYLLVTSGVASRLTLIRSFYLISNADRGLLALQISDLTKTDAC